ncbi:recombinase family protein [Ruthenibacterium lactatiformans]|uniref:recombinase family protein n=1 Tax=Ruthenibacterium lactatiformans TaxID=1550024 RepID=UPI001313DF8F|nr:recombinase family protein [Ruthenibacterium lactatiformans]
MRAWLYYRLSRDEDEELNSLTNQRSIIAGYAEKNGFTIAGESFDDNVSGMHFDRDGIEKICEAVEQNQIDAVIVKDLSRLGRHRTQTAVFIDYLKKHDVRVISVTENIDTSNENDDLVIGMKQIINDMYAKDASRKIRSTYRQKQKEGIVIIPPFGYFKDKNTRQVVIVEEAADTVRLIFKLYLDGYGFKQIAKKLNADGVHTPAYYQQTLLGKNVPHTWPQISKQQLWISTTIKRILENEFYAGTLICHKTRTDKINKTFRFIPPEEQYRHENAVPAIIDRETWQQAQFLLQKRVKDRVWAAPGQKIHRYTGIIECADCHSVCTARTRKLPQGGRRVEYICNTYHRYGKEYCTTHLIREEVLDDLVYKELLRVKKMAHANWEAIDALAKDWAAQKFNAERQIDRLQERISVLKNEVEQILMERIRDKAHADIYDVMLQKRDEAIQSAEQQINEYRDAQASLEARKESMQPGIDLLDAITSEGSVSDAHLRMFVNKVYLHEQDGKLRVEFVLNADFQTHLDLYDQNGELKDVCNDLGYYFSKTSANASA